jgi:hypothetical protein
LVHRTARADADSALGKMLLLLAFLTASAVHAIDVQCQNQCDIGSFATRQPSACNTLAQLATLTISDLEAFPVLPSGKYRLRATLAGHGQVTVIIDDDQRFDLTEAEPEALFTLPSTNPLHLPTKRQFVVLPASASASAVDVSLAPLELVMPCQTCRSCVRDVAPCTQNSDRICAEAGVIRARRSLGNITLGKLARLSACSELLTMCSSSYLSLFV